MRPRPDFQTTQITVTIQGSNDAPTDITAGTLSIAENSANTITYSLDNAASGLFAINSSTGVVTVAAGLDYETATSHSITVRATSADGSFATQTFNIAVTDVSESGVSEISDADATTDFVAENSANGTAVGVTAFASDADGTDSVSYSLDANAGGRFAIDSATGVVTVAGAIDREAAGNYYITVRATSTDTSTTTRLFTITIGDVNEFATSAVSDANLTANSVAENVSVRTVVNITSLASDSDATTNTITYSLVDNDGGRFAIDGITGVVTVAGAINRETDGATRNMTVRATSADGSFTDQIFAIAINDLDEFNVGAVTDTNATANTVAENSANGTVVGLTAFASDADATTNAITYSLDDNAGGRFTINSTTGVVTVLDGSLLDYEAATSHNITIRATSSDTSTATQVMTITLTDVNETPVAMSDSAIAVEAGGTSNGTPGTNPSGNVLTNDTDVDAADTKTESGVVAGVSAGVSGSVGGAVAGTYGTINIAANGTFSYVVNNNNAAVQALRTSSDTLTDTFTYTMTDSGSLTSSTQMTITIQGANDAPVGINDSSTAVEAGGVANGTAGSDASGAVLTNDTDVDSGDTKTVTGIVAGVSASASGSVGANVAGTFGSITLNSDGTYSYSIDNTNAAVQALAIGGTLQDVFTYTVTDAGDLASTARITSTIEGANDAPVIVANSLTISESGTVVLTNADLLATDSDNTAAQLTYTGTGVTGGRFEFLATPGVAIISFTQAQVNGGLVQFVHDGNEAAPGYHVTVSDGITSNGPQAVTVNFTGSNDSPVMNPATFFCQRIPR